MPIRVLVAEEDSHEHKVIRDIVGVCFKDVRITHALTHDTFAAKVLRAKAPFDIILYDYHFDESSGKNGLLTIFREKPELREKVVLLNNSAEELAANPEVKSLPYILKPFSLDAFSSVVKKIGASKTSR